MNDVIRTVLLAVTLALVAVLGRYETFDHQGIPLYQFDRWRQCYVFVGPLAIEPGAPDQVPAPLCD